MAVQLPGGRGQLAGVSAESELGEQLRQRQKLAEMERKWQNKWEDIRFPLIGEKLTTSGGRVDFNFTTLSVDFASNARYHVDEQLSFIVQMPHDWVQGTELRPHIHWLQKSGLTPNWLIEWRGPYEVGDTISSDWNIATYVENAKEWKTGTIHQIASFPPIPMTNVNSVSCIVDIKVYRDTANASGLFDGADPLGDTVSAKEFDLHYLKNALGSEEEISKYVDRNRRPRK